MYRARILLLTAIVSLISACASTPKTAAPAAAPAPAPAPAPAVTNLAGNWILTIESQMGAQDTNLVLTQNGKDLAGTFESPMGSANGKGAIDGNNIKFGFPFSAQGTELQIDFIGTTDGQTMAGRAVFGSFGEGTFKAKRK